MTTYSAAVGPAMNCAKRACLRRLPHRDAAKSKSQARRISGPYGYTQAKALVYSQHGRPQDVFDLHAHSISPPHSTLVTLQTLAAPLNPADINQVQGTYASLPTFDSATSSSYGINTATPSAVAGNEACFRVIAAGSAVKSVKKGDWVIPQRTGLGAWRTHAQVDESKVFKVVDAEEAQDSANTSITSKQVSTVSVNPVTAYRMLEDFLMRPLYAQGQNDGDNRTWYIQNGANSAVGRAALQLGRQKWALKSIAVIRARSEGEESALKQELLDLGADKVVTDTELLDKGFKERVEGWTNGGREPVQLGLNCVGGDSALAMAKVLSPGGSMVTYGGMSRAPLRVPTSMLIFQDLKFFGFWVSRWADKHPEEKKATVLEMVDMYRQGKFKDSPTVDVPWTWETKRDELVQAAQDTLDGFRKGKALYVFKDT